MYFLIRESCFLPSYPELHANSEKLQRSHTLTSPRYADDFRVVIHLIYQPPPQGVIQTIQIPNGMVSITSQPIMNPLTSGIMPLQQPQQPIAIGTSQNPGTIGTPMPMVNSGDMSAMTGMMPTGQVMMMQGPNGLIPVMVVSPQGQFQMQSPGVVSFVPDSSQTTSPVLIPEATIVVEP